MITSKRIYRINLLLLLLFAIVAAVPNSSGGYASLDFMVLYLGLFAIQIGANLIFGTYMFINQKKKLGQTFLLAALMILLIGSSSCWGIAIAIQ